MEKAEQQWEQEGELEEEEEALRGRLPRNQNHTTSATGNGTSITVSNGNGDNSEDIKHSPMTANGADQESSSIQEQGPVDLKISKDDIDNYGIETENGQERSEKCIYYDQVKGTGITYGSSGTEPSSVERSTAEENPGDGRLDATVQDFDIQKSLSTVINHQYEENLKDESLSSSSIQPSEISFVECNTSSKSFNNRGIESADAILIKESDQEVTDLDVERVLEKQDTHDLYCPNCNSCITKRVIIRKRKRKIRISSEEAKRNKLETVVDSELDAISAHATNDQDRNAVDICLGPTPAANDYDRGREPDIFRCLSCFSFFIPTGNGFKLFRKFGDKSLNENIQDPEQIPKMNKNWLSSIFAADKGEMLIERGSGRRTDVEKINVGAVIPSSNFNDQNGQALSIQEAPSPVQTFVVGGLVKSRTTEPQEGGDDILPSSTEEAAQLGKVMVDVGEKSDDSTKKSKGGATLDHSEVDTVNQLNSSSLSNKVLPNHKSDLPVTSLAGRTPVNIGEPAENITLIPQEDGQKLLIPSNVASSIIAKSWGDQKLDVALQKKTADEKETNSLLPTPVSIVGKSDMDGKANISADIPCENEQYVEATVLTGSVVENGNADVKISDKGKDTIIIVEAGPLEPATSQRAQNVIVSAETGASPQIETQIHVVEQKGAEPRGVHVLDIIKSIVYGGLIELITSLGVVSSAAGGDAATLNVLALGLANLIGGLFIIGHGLWELKNDRSGEASNQVTEQVDRYQELLGRRENFLLHVTVAVLSFLILGLVPPVIYGFSFRKSDDRELKLVAVMAASLLCIFILASGKAYVQRPPKSYIETLVYYVTLGLMVSGVSFVVGHLIKRLLEKLGLFQSALVVTLPLPVTRPTKAAWASS